MTITNGYATLAEFKANLRIDSTDVADDSVIERIIEGASRVIDNETRRTFYARTATNKYDVPDSGILYIEDDDLLTITTLTNGDAEVLTTTDYILLPNNSSPKYAVKLKDASTKTWEGDSSGNTEQVITIAGTWGYSSTAPLDIKEFCMETALSYYRQRFGENMGTESFITASGVMVTAKDIPASARAGLQNYARLA